MSGGSFDYAYSKFRMFTSTETLIPDSSVRLDCLRIAMQLNGGMHPSADQLLTAARALYEWAISGESGNADEQD
jgi:hypothetical protein